MYVHPCFIFVCPCVRLDARCAMREKEGYRGKCGGVEVEKEGGREGLHMCVCVRV